MRFSVQSRLRISNVVLAVLATATGTFAPWVKSAQAEIWTPNDAPTEGFELQATRSESDEQLFAPQLSKVELSLTAQTSLLGTYGKTASDVIKDIAPHLEKATTILKDVVASGDNVHETWELIFRGYPLYRASIQMHFHKNKLILLRTNLPSYRLYNDEEELEFLLPDQLGFTYDSATHASFANKVLANNGGMMSTAWHIVTRNIETDTVQELLVDATSGAILESKQTGSLPLAKVYEKNPTNGVFIETDLKDLNNDGYLEGKHFSVLAPDIKSPRAMAPDNVFVYNPDDIAEAVHFDEVQAYYSATKAMNWFSAKLGVEFLDGQIPIRVNDLIKGRPDNALYVMPPFGPEIKIGKGSVQIRNLARDTDVMFHEFSHHVVYKYLKSLDGDAGILHEGYADYFAYAMNGDPYLGESVVLGKPYLRTGKLDPYIRFDDQENSNKHIAGQIWSAVLWRLHEEMGMAADKLVYSSLAYLGQQGGFKDALIALLNADRDLNPLSKDDPDYEIFGTNKCAIISAAVDRGFATFIEDVDASSCQMDLKELAQQSRDLNEKRHGIKTKGKGVTINLFGKKCAVIVPGQFSNAVGSTGSGVFALFLPLCLVLLRRLWMRET
jgi:hypothetical protein